MRSTPLLLDTNLRRWQDLFWQTMGQENVLLCHRRAGKSMAMALVASFIIYLNKVTGLNIGLFCPSLKKARDLLFYEVKDLLQSEATPFFDYLKGELVIVNTQTNSKLKFFALSEDRGTMCRGETLTVIILDEADECSAKEWAESALPTTNGLPPQLRPHRRIIMAGTMRGSTSLLSNTIAKFAPLSPPTLNDVDVYQSPSDPNPEPIHIPQELQDALKKTKYRFYHFPVEKTGLILEEDLASARLFQGQATYDREFSCSLTAQSDDVLFPLLDLQATIQHPHLNLQPDAHGHISEPDRNHRAYRPLSAGLDIGISHDATQLFIKQGTVPLYMGTIRTEDSMSLTRSNMRHQIDSIKKILLRYGCKRIACDAGGVGSFMVAEMRDDYVNYGIDVQPLQGQERPLYEWAEEFVNLRSNLLGLVALHVREHAPLPDMPQLFEQLSAHTKKDQLNDNRTAVISKKDVKVKLGGVSPDLSDALAYAFYWDGLDAKEDYFLNLADVADGTVAISREELERRFPAMDDNRSNAFWDSSIINPKNGTYDD